MRSRHLSVEHLDYMLLRTHTQRHHLKQSRVAKPSMIQRSEYAVSSDKRRLRLNRGKLRRWEVSEYKERIDKAKGRRMK